MRKIILLSCDFLKSISRANLNKSYFTDRQDRYLHFSSQPALSQYCFDFLKTVSTFSYRLLPVIPTSQTNSPTDRHSYTRDDFTLHWPDPQTHPHKIHQRAETLLREFQKTYLDKSLGERSSTSNCTDATLFPLIQAGQINVHEEETTFQLLFRHLKLLKSAHRPLLDLTSGYFNLYKPYQDLILSSPGVDCRIVAASPEVRNTSPLVIPFPNLHLSGKRILRFKWHFGSNSGGVYPL